MIIRLSQEKDIENIVALWNEAFGDSHDEIMFFINNKYYPKNTLVAVENGEIASVLFLLDGKMCINKTDYPSYYLYAACTLKKFRGRGIMAKMLEEAKNLSASRGIDFICLMPGEKTLFDFYSKFGYKTVFYKKILQIDIDNTEYLSVENKNTDSLSLEEFRNKAFSEYNYFKWDENAIEFAVSHNKIYGGDVYKTCNGYCLYNECNNEMYVKEFAFTDLSNLKELMNLAKLNNCKKITINLPSEYATEFGEYDIQPSGMLLPISDNAKLASLELTDAYLGLTLD